MEIKEILSSIGLTALSISGFYVVYHLLFARDHQFQLSRIVILMALLFSFVFPFVSPDLGATTYTSPRAFLPMEEFWEPMMDKAPVQVFQQNEMRIQPLNVLMIIYCLVVFLFLMRYAFKLFSILRIIRQHEKIKFDSFTLIKLEEGSPTFSFGNYIFSDQLPDQHNQAMFDHEKCHVRQRHSYDLLLVEIMLSLQWFNPFIYLLKNKLVQVHEFLADHYVLHKGHSKGSYLQLMLEASGLKFHPHFTSSFHSNTFKRIKMMNTHKKIYFNNWRLVSVLIFGIAIISLHSCLDQEEVKLPGKTIDQSDSSSESIDKKTAVADEDENLIFRQLFREGEAELSAGYGMRMHPILKYERMHTGIDYKAQPGTKIYAPLKGKVVEASLNGSYGNMIVIDHLNGFTTRYAHLKSMEVKKGDDVYTGQEIGKVGNTGLSMAPHLHLEMWLNGEHVNPINYLKTNLSQRNGVQ